MDEKQTTDPDERIADLESLYDRACDHWQLVSEALIGRRHGKCAELLEAIAALKENQRG